MGTTHQHACASMPLDDQFVARAAEHVRDLRRSGASTREILTQLVTAAETVSGPRSVVSILVLDQDGLLRNGASPNLPSDYLAAIDRLKPNPNLGTCASAAATGCIVFTPDFAADGKWAELRHLPQSLGFVGAWSMPILSDKLKVLGTFGTYYRDRRTPTPREQSAVKKLAEAAAVALDTSSS
jgi:GAF domain-containing protein